MTDDQVDERRQGSKRIQFEFSSDAVERLDRMKRETNSGSYADLVRNALRVFEWVVETEQKGFDVGVVKDDELVRVVKFLY